VVSRKRGPPEKKLISLWIGPIFHDRHGTSIGRGETSHKAGLGHEIPTNDEISVPIIERHCHASSDGGSSATTASIGRIIWETCQATLFLARQQRPIVAVDIPVNPDKRLSPFTSSNGVSCPAWEWHRESPCHLVQCLAWGPARMYNSRCDDEKRVADLVVSVIHTDL